MLAAASPVGADNIGQILSISTGHSMILHGHGITKIAIGDGAIASAVPLDRSKVLLNPKSAGNTSVFLWDASGQHTYELTVTDDRMDRIVGILRTSIDSPYVTVTALGSTIFVSGKVADVAQYQRIDASIAKFKNIKFEGVTTLSVVDGLEVDKPLGTLQDQIATVPGASNLRVDLAPSGDVVVSGRVRDRQQAQGVLDQVGGLAGPYLKADGKVVDRLALEAKSQIDIKVDVLEIDRTAASTLGLRLQTAQQTTVGGQYTVGSTQSITLLESPTGPATLGNSFAVGPFARVSLLAPTLDLLMTEGHAKILSSPTLVTLPGKAATFLVGGEIPIPVSNGLGTVTIDYKTYGVQLNVTPTIGADGSVESIVAPEVSDLDFADGVSLNGYTVPALKVSQLSTDVVTQTGESIILGGLLSRMESKNIQKIPLLGDIPILGQFFRDTTYSRTDEDVAFVLTPTILTRTQTVANTTPDSPAASVPVASPVASVPVANAPVASAPVKRAPVASVPFALPVARTVASVPLASPVASAPAASTPVATAPIGLPLASAPVASPASTPIIGLPAASAPVASRVASTPVASPGVSHVGWRRVMPPIHFVAVSADATPQPRVRTAGLPAPSPQTYINFRSVWTGGRPLPRQSLRDDG